MFFAGMARQPRENLGNSFYHVINRGNRRFQIFENSKDYRLFENILFDAINKFSTDLLAYCLMPNHWHLMFYTHQDGELSDLMKWIGNAHTRRYHKIKGTIGTGPIYQGRFKSVATTDDEQLHSTIRYIERNPIQAGLIEKAADWRWSSAWWYQSRPEDFSSLFCEDRFRRGNDWLLHVDS